MRKLTLTLSAAALAVTGVAYAAPGAGGPGGFDRDAPVTRAQAETRANAMFDRIDFNKDGKLDQADREARKAQRFDRMDTDKNGSISKAEFMAKRERPAGADGAKAGKPDGEHRGHWGGKRGGGRHHGGGFMMMMKADTNGDGAVSKAEFVTASLARFDAADANKDGTVTKEERRAAFEAKREQWKQDRAAKAAQ